MSKVPWKEASSLIIATRASISQRVALDLGTNLTSFTRVQSDSKPQNHLTYETIANGKVDYRLLMVKRSEVSSFMASAYVFPGGKAELADFSSKWWSVFSSLGKKKDEIISYFEDRIQGPRPPMVTHPVTVAEAKLKDPKLNEEFLPGNIALRITAIRETFEETGI